MYVLALLLSEIWSFKNAWLWIWPITFTQSQIWLCSSVGLPISDFLLVFYSNRMSIPRRLAVIAAWTFLPSLIIGRKFRKSNCITFLDHTEGSRQNKVDWYNICNNSLLKTFWGIETYRVKSCTSSWNTFNMHRNDILMFRLHSRLKCRYNL